MASSYQVSDTAPAIIESCRPHERAAREGRCSAATVTLGSTPKNYHTMLLLHCSRSFWLYSRFSRMRGSEVSPLRVSRNVLSLFAGPCVVSDLLVCCCGGTAVPSALAPSRVYQHRAETTPAQRSGAHHGRHCTPDGRPTPSRGKRDSASCDARIVGAQGGHLAGDSASERRRERGRQRT